MAFGIKTDHVPKPRASDADGDKLLSDLQQLVPVLRERAAAAEVAARIPDETIAELSA